MMMGRADYPTATQVVFGRGRIAELRRYLPPEVERVMIVTDLGVLRGSGGVARILKVLADDYETEAFTEVESNPSFETVDCVTDIARDFGAELVIGCGGGSPMDVAKGVALLAAQPAAGAVSMKECLACGGELVEEVLPVVCVPTTAGTGSEVTPFAVFTDRVNGNKGGYTDERISPRVAIVDADLMDSMPREVVLDTGLDALTHGIEAYLSTESTPTSDIAAMRAIENIRDRLDGAAGGDRDALEAMAEAALWAGIAIAEAGTILLHVMGYPLTVFGGVAHGRANAALLPAFMGFMQEAGSGEAREKAAQLETMFAEVGGLRGFVEGLGVATDLGAYGVGVGDLDLYISKCVGKSDLRITPLKAGVALDGAAIRAIYGRAGLGD